MKTLPPALQAHLESGTTTLSACWRVTLKSGAVFGFTDHDLPLEFDGVIFEPESGFTGTEVKASLGMAVPTKEIAGKLDSTRIREGDLRAGLWDNSEILEYLVNWRDVTERVLVRTTDVGRVKYGELGFVAEMRGIAHDLNQAKGRHYDPNCDAEFGDHRCTLDLDGDRYKATGEIGSSDGSLHLYPLALVTVAGNDSEGLFSGGTLTFTSGDNTGLIFKIKMHIGSGADVHVLLRDPTPYDIEDGDTFTATIGCDKRAETCHHLFNNLLNFRGFNLIPGNDRAMAAIDPDDEYGNDGGSLFREPDDRDSVEGIDNQAPLSNPYPTNGGYFGGINGGDE